MDWSTKTYNLDNDEERNLRESCDGKINGVRDELESYTSMRDTDLQKKCN